MDNNYSNLSAEPLMEAALPFFLQQEHNLHIFYLKKK